MGKGENQVSIVCIGDSLTFGYGVKEDIVVKSWFEDMDYKKVNKSLIELRSLLIQYGKGKNIACINLGGILLKEGTIKKQFLKDGIHVSKEIHKKIAEIIYASIF